jgi:pimeloyl-ACP methyl ester carboxylesterase
MTTMTALRTSLRVKAASAAAIVLLALTGCSGSGSGSAQASSAAASTAGDGGTGATSSSPSASALSMPSTDPALARFTEQKVEWSSCEGTFECATFTVPVDYAKPDGETTTIRAIRLTSPNPQAGTLFVNPGGPGGSGYDMLAQGADRFASAAIKDNYSVIGFDPRGVGKSDPIACLTDAQMDEQRAQSLDLTTPAGLAQAHSEAKSFGAACQAKSGPVIEHMDTASVAKDLDVMRAAVGSPRLNFLGYSYGTYIGSMYATLFPKNVGRFVLDGAVDPTLPEQQINLDQAAGFEHAVSEYIKSCQSQGACPLSGSPDEAKKQLTAILERYRATPGKASDGRTVTADDLMQAVILPMYNDQYWPILTKALTPLIKQNNPNAMMQLADIAMDRDENGHYTTNSNAAFTAINCLDKPLATTDAEMARQAADLANKSPFIGPFIGYSQLSCVEWPIKPAAPAPKISIPESLDVLVVGTTGDPATPYPWAKRLTSIFGSTARLLTYEGNGHTAYGRESSCINTAVEAYLANGTMPAEGTVCS